jgi:WD40 repeat protein
VDWREPWRQEEERVAPSFSPNGTRVLTVSSRGQARLWDRDGDEMATFRGPRSGVIRLRFSPGEDRVLTSSLNASPRIWLVDGADLLGLAEARVTRDFAAEERERFADLLSPFSPLPRADPVRSSQEVR